VRGEGNANVITVEGKGSMGGGKGYGIKRQYGKPKRPEQKGKALVKLRVEGKAFLRSLLFRGQNQKEKEDRHINGGHQRGRHKCRKRAGNPHDGSMPNRDKEGLFRAWNWGEGERDPIAKHIFGVAKGTFEQ